MLAELGLPGLELEGLLGLLFMVVAALWILMWLLL